MTSLYQAPLDINLPYDPVFASFENGALDEVSMMDEDDVDSELMRHEHAAREPLLYRGLSSLYDQRTARELKQKKRKLPILSVLYTTAFLQCLIVLCITVIVQLRGHTEYFFLNIGQTFEAIFGGDLNRDLHRTDYMSSALRTKFDIYFNLTSAYTDHFIYPQSILVENTSSGHSTHHNLVPTALLTFTSKADECTSYTIDPGRPSMLALNESEQLLSALSTAKQVSARFEVESYSFVNDVRNRWQWHIVYSILLDEHSQRYLSDVDVTYRRLDQRVSWWNERSAEFRWSVIASFGLCAFSIMALARFAYKHGFCFLFDATVLKRLQFRMMMPLSHILSLTCGILYLFNLSNIADFNDEWLLRLCLALTVLTAWCMLVFTISTHGTEYGALFRTMRISFEPLMILIVSFFPIAIGFILFAALVFSVPNDENKFTNPEMTAKTLYAVWLGDEVWETFYAAGVGNPVAEVFMYSWGILFIAVIHNVQMMIIATSYFLCVPQLDTSREPPVQRHELTPISNDEAAVGAANAEDVSRRGHSMVDYSKEWTLSDANVPPLFLYGDKQSSDQTMDLALDADESKKRNLKFATMFVKHLKKEVIGTISNRLIEKNVSKLLLMHPIHSQLQFDLFQNEVSKNYKHYLNTVKKDVTRYIASFNAPL